MRLTSFYKRIRIMLLALKLMKSLIKHNRQLIVFTMSLKIINGLVPKNNHHNVFRGHNHNRPCIALRHSIHCTLISLEIA